MGVSLIAGYVALVGMLPLAVSVQLLVDPHVPLWAAFLQALLALWMFLSAAGLWRLHRWGFWLAISYYAFALIDTLPRLLRAFAPLDTEDLAYTAIVCWQFAISGLIVIYLLQPSIRHMFNHSEKGNRSATKSREHS